MENGNIILFLILVGVGILFVVGSCSYKSGYKFDNSMYSYGNPNTAREAHYYQCIKDECGGDTHDYDCLEKCHLKSYRKGMKTIDHADWVCYNYRFDEHAYYKCLDSVYADYRYP